MAAANYGIDAPGVVRNLLLAAALCVGAWLCSAFALWSGALKLGPVTLILAPALLSIGIVCAIMGGWMLYDSLWGKLRLRDKLLAQVPWTGGEQVLDVGCGRGLLLIGAAKKLTTGKAVGIDIWQAVDLSGNQDDAARANAEAEGVSDRVKLETADMRAIPFPDATFDVILSRAAIHNLPTAEDRAKTIREIARVLKPGGYFVLDDIANGALYHRELLSSGCGDIRPLGSWMVNVLATCLSFGTLRPTSFCARKLP